MLKPKRNNPQVADVKKNLEVNTGPESKDSGPSVLTKIGLGIFLISLITAGIIFYPAIISEFKYFFIKPNQNLPVTVDLLDDDSDVRPGYIVAADNDFSIIIPKIGANVKVFRDVDSQNADEYQQVLTQGVAHAANTPLPDQEGNTFIFAHSSDNFYNANRYNAVFYLLNKLVSGDAVYIVYEGKKYEYQVSQSKIVGEQEIEFMQNTPGAPKVTLMTCWPPGTTLKRLIVVADRVL